VKKNIINVAFLVAKSFQQASTNGKIKAKVRMSDISQHSQINSASFHTEKVQLFFCPHRKKALKRFLSRASAEWI
jgi:hypothetical protein